MNTQVPENLSEATDDQIAEVETALVAEFDALVDAKSTDVAAMTEIADAIDNVRAVKSERAVALAAAQEQVAALADRVHVASVEAPAEESAPAAEEVVETPSEEAPKEEETATAEAPAEAPSHEESEVSASADKTSPKALSARAVRAQTIAPEAPKPQPEVLVAAAADVPGFSGGQNLSKTDIAKAMHAKARTLSNGSGMVPVASIHLPIENKLGADLAYNLDVLERVTAPSSLTAAGWCAPSNNLYELFGIDAGDGLIDLPTVQITRGGLNVPSFLGIGDATDALWTWTEDSASEEETKPCLYIPCPEFVDYRLKAEGLCLTNGNLTDRAFPELTSRFVALAINAHLHRLSAAIIADLLASAVGVTMNAVASSAAGSILHAVDVQVADYRSQYRMAVSTVLEVIFPLWAKELLRADLAMRQGVNLTNVSDADIDAHFATRKVRAQFLHDYQPMFSGSPAQGFAGTMDFAIYPAGGFVRGDGGVIDLGVVRDSVLNATNDYTAAWTEQMYLVAKLGPDAREVTVNYDVSGSTGCCETPVVS